MDKNIELELKHIQLEIKQSRNQHLRHFIDQYFCFTNGYVRKNGKANWDLIFWKEYVSLSAKNVTDKKQVVKEHIVPIKVISDKLMELGENCSISEIKVVLDKYIKFATITKNEDQLLRKLKLNHRMPDEFYKHDSEFFNDIFSRYKIAGIMYEKV